MGPWDVELANFLNINHIFSCLFGVHENLCYLELGLFFKD